MSVGDLRENALPTGELPGCRRLVIKDGARILTQVGLISNIYIYIYTHMELSNIFFIFKFQ